MTAVLCDVVDDIGWITLNRPQQMNAVTVALARELHEAIVGLGGRTDVNVMVIQGAGGNFCSGGDLGEVESLREDGPDALRGLFAAFRRACDAVSQVDVPVVAAVEGVAMAGGFELMQAADIVLVSDSARIADNHINFGMIPGGGSTQRLSRLVGRQQALGLLLSGESISGVEAVRLGLAYRSFPFGEFDSGVKAFAKKLAGRRREAVSEVKRLVYANLEVPAAAGLDDETDSVVAHICGRGADSGAVAFRQRAEKR